MLSSTPRQLVNVQEQQLQQVLEQLEKLVHTFEYTVCTTHKPISIKQVSMSSLSGNTLIVTFSIASAALSICFCYLIGLLAK